MTRWHRPSMCLVVAAATIFAESASAQQPELKPGEAYFSLTAGGGYRFKSSFDDGGGDVAMARYAVGFDANIQLTRDWAMTARVDYTHDKYDFAPVPALGGIRPWDDVNTLDAVVSFRWSTTDEITLFGGPVFQLAAEDGSDLAESLVGGGFLGGVYKFSDTLSFGAGLGVVTEIEDDLNVFPIVILNWQINDRLRLASRPRTGASGFFAIIELVYNLGEGWEVALGGAYESRRFRLTDGDSAPVPNGVGEVQGMPIYVRLSKYLARSLQVEVLGGFSFNGEYQIDNSSGDEIAHVDLDTQPFLMGSVIWRF